MFLWLKNEYESIDWDWIGAVEKVNSASELRFQIEFKIYKSWGQIGKTKGLLSDNHIIGRLWLQGRKYDLHITLA